MSDETELNGTEPSVPEGAAVVAAPKAPSADFLSTTAGKAVLIGGAAVVLLIIAGVVGWFVLGPSSLGTGTTGTPTTLVPAPSQLAASSATTPSTVPTVPAADITSRDVFTPRNPFTPIAAPTITTKSSSTSTSTTTSTTSDSDVVLKDVVTVSGVRKAVIAYGGHTYTLGAGELIPTTTDWKVLAVNVNSAVIQFGDVNVTLTPGQGTTK